MLRIRAFGLDIYGCREALERLDDFVDRELSADEARKVAQHLRICRECARKFAFEQELLAGLRAKIEQIVSSPEVPEMEALKAKIAQSVASERLTLQGQKKPPE